MREMHIKRLLFLEYIQKRLKASSCNLSLEMNNTTNSKSLQKPETLHRKSGKKDVIELELYDIELMQSNIYLLRSTYYNQSALIVVSDAFLLNHHCFRAFFSVVSAYSCTGEADLGCRSAQHCQQQ
jgi:hypothetical protein